MSTPVTLAPAAQEPGGDFLRSAGRHDLVGGPAGELDEVRQVAFARLALQPDRHRPVARLVGEHDQVAVSDEAAVRQSPGPGLGVRDTDGGHGCRLHTL